MKILFLALAVLLISVAESRPGSRIRREDESALNSTDSDSGELGPVDIIPDESEEGELGPVDVIPDFPEERLRRSSRRKNKGKKRKNKNKKNKSQSEEKKTSYHYYSFETETPSIIDHGGNGGTGKAGGCTKEYAQLKDSILCSSDYPDYDGVTEYGVSLKDIQFIIKKLNEYRAEENAEDMTKIFWDYDLAIPAQKLAQSCQYRHDSQNNRAVPGYELLIGQNLCFGQKDWESCLHSLHSEKRMFVYGGPNAIEKVGHYTQIVSRKANNVGCGFARCTGQRMETVFVCNFAYGQTLKEISEPFALGKPCERCPNYCDKNGLCNCGNKVCKNGGRLNISTCECACSPPFVGETCGEVQCSKDKRFCNTGSYVPGNCKKIRTVREKCPNMCDIC